MQDPKCSPERIEHAITLFQEGTEVEASFELLMDCFYAGVRGFFTSKGLTAEEAKDLTQNTFLRVYRGLRAFRGDSKFSTWLYRIARNILWARCQKRGLPLDNRRQTERDSAEGDDAKIVDPSTDLKGADKLIWKQRQERLVSAIGRLPEQMRQCMILRIYEELKYREIATVMKISIDTVKAHLHQGRKRLEEILNEESAGL